MAVTSGLMRNDVATTMATRTSGSIPGAPCPPAAIRLLSDGRRECFRSGIEVLWKDEEEDAGTERGQDSRAEPRGEVGSPVFAWIERQREIVAAFVGDPARQEVGGAGGESAHGGTMR